MGDHFPTFSKFIANKIKEKKLDKLGINSAYYNGNIYLYLSVEQDKAINEIIWLFLEIDLKKKLFIDNISKQ